MSIALADVQHLLEGAIEVTRRDGAEIERDHYLCLDGRFLACFRDKQRTCYKQARLTPCAQGARHCSILVQRPATERFSNSATQFAARGDGSQFTY